MKEHYITIRVTLDGKDVYRNYQTEHLEDLKAELMGSEVLDMIATLRGLDKPFLV